MKKDDNNQDKISNGVNGIILHNGFILNGFTVKEILIPKYNEYPFDKGQAWANRGYNKALPQVSEWKAKFLKRDFQIRAADYVEKMTFIKWRLTGSSIPPTPLNKGGTKGGITLRPEELSVRRKSPLDTALECLKPYVSNWGKFRLEFTNQLKDAFEAIHNSNYLPDMVKDRNDWINQVLANFARSVPSPFPSPSRGEGRERVIHLEFVPHPETVESYDSPRFLEMRSNIWKYYTGEGLDLSKYVPTTTPIPGRPCQMEMHLDIQVSLI